MEQAHDELEAELVALFGNNLWIDQRHQCAQIIEYLSKRECDQQNWLSFFKKLSDKCMGEHFVSDKQWGTLLNLMGISRKLNHRSVKVRDIMKVRVTIESRWTDICELNEAATISKTIETLLAELDTNLNRKACLMLRDLQEGCLESILQAREFLVQNCQRLIVTLKLELRNNLISDDRRRPDWVKQLERLDADVEKLLQFLNRFETLKIKLSHLQALIGTDISAIQVEDLANSETPLISAGLSKCKQLFIRSRLFIEQQMYPALLRCNKSRKNADNNFLVLARILNSSGEFVDPVFNQQLCHTLSMLDECQTSLDTIMSSLRQEFGRFYFMSDLELLNIIALDVRLLTESSREKYCSSLLRKLFNGSISECIIDQDGQAIVGVRNDMGELVTFEAISLQQRHDIYRLKLTRILYEISRRIRHSLKALLISHARIASIDRDWYEPDLSLPVQLICLLEHLDFSDRVENTLNDEPNCLRKLIEYYEKRFISLSSMKNPEKQVATISLKRSAQLSLTVHFVSTLRELDLKQVVRSTSWEWQKQLRYYLIERDEGNELEVRIAYTRYFYKFNFLPIENSNSVSGVRIFKRLIHTRYNQRCFVVASEAFCNLKLGSQPYGPAGSGKTESIKALGHALGCQVVVHNCDQTNDIESLKRILSGLAQVGLWGCLDEFNRLSASVLSAISSHLEFIQSALQESKTNITFAEGEPHRIDPDCAFFLTLNPNDSGRYQGRRRLPANLRSLFLPISMNRVQIDRIMSESLLALVGDLKLDLAACKQTSSSELCFRLARQVSKWLEIAPGLSQSTCEWDLRLMLAVLRRLRLIAIQDGLKLEQLELAIVKSIITEVEPRLESRQLLCESLRNFLNLPTELSHIKHIGDNSNVSRDQLRGQLETHSGVILLGSPSSGKSSTWRSLASTSPMVEWLSLNPRAFSNKHFLGYIHPVSFKFIDGVFTSLIKKASRSLECNDKLQEVWIILDGPIDPDWIESLNSVLDDNCTLTLGSGERIQFCHASGKCIKLVFETDSIDYASPATISRLGLVFHRGLDRTDTDRTGTIASFISNPASKLMLITGHSSTSSKVSFAQQHLHLAGYSANDIRYYCSSGTTADRILEVLSLAQSGDLITLVEANKIQCDHEKWQVKSCLQLINYVITYSGYYDLDTNNFTHLDCKFLILTNSPSDVDKRLLSKAELFRLDNELEEVAVHKVEESSVVALIKKSHSPVHILLADESKQLKRSLLSTYDARETLQFNNSKTAKQTVDRLGQILDQKYTGTTDQLYVIDGVEFALLEKTTRAKLLHQLEMVKIRKTCGLKFVLLVDVISRESIMKLASHTLISPVTCLAPEWPLDWQDVTEGWFPTITNSVTTQQWSNLIASIEAIYKFDPRLHKFKNKSRSMINLACQILNLNLSRIHDEKRTLANGLRWLESFDNNIKQVELKCASEEELLNRKKMEIERLMTDVDHSLKVVSEKKKQLISMKELESKKSAEIISKRDILKSGIASVSKQVDESLNEIAKHLKPEALSEIRTLRSPPKTIKDILDVLFTLLGIADISWTSIKMQLAKRSLRDELTNYNFSKNLTDNLIENVQAQMDEKRDSFQEQQATRASVAILPIVGWIKATVNYGRMLQRLRPLENELKELVLELDKLQENTTRLEVEQEQLDRRLNSDSQHLKLLQFNFEQSKLSLDTNSLKIKQAQEALVNCSFQVTRWKDKLEVAEKKLRDADIPRACLLASHVALFPCDSFGLAQAAACLGIHDLHSIKRLIVELVSTFGAQEIGFEIENDRLDNAVQVSLAKLCMVSGDLAIPVFELDDCHDKLKIKRTVAELVNILITGKSVGDTCLINLDEMSESLSQRVELAMRLGKLTIVIISEDSSSGCLLDLLDSISRHGCKNLVCLGRLNPQIHQIAGHCFRYFLSDSQENEPDHKFTSSILDCLMDAHDANLKASTEILCRDLAESKNKLRALEMKLLQKLADMEIFVESDLDKTTIDLLKNLHKLSESIALEVEQKEGQLEELEKKQEMHHRFAGEAANFYLGYVRRLETIDTFYQVSLCGFQNLITRYLSVEDCKSSSFREGAKNFVLQHVVTSMRPIHADEFIRVVSENGTNKPPETASMVNRLELKQILLGMIGESSKTNCHDRMKLVVISHESSSSSPHTQIDELFRQQIREHLSETETAQHVMVYSKVYATSDRTPRTLEQALASLSQGHIGNEGENTRGTRKLELKCVCIVNAHLAAKWLNSHLPALLETYNNKPPCDQLGSKQSRLLLLLVGEMSGSSLSIEVYEQAQIRLWYDELSQAFCDRYNLLSYSLARASGLTDGSYLHELAKQLILFHVVCQELTKLGRWTNNNCAFNYDQICLAFKNLDRQLRTCKNEDTIRENLCHYLEDVVYGPQSDSQEDDIMLGNLLSRFLLSEDLARVQMDRLILLLQQNKTPTSQANQQRLINDFIR